MSKVLLVAFDRNDVALLGGYAASQKGEIHVLSILGGDVANIGASTVSGFGLGEVPPADAAASGIAAVAADYTHIAAVSTMLSKDVLARLAGLLNAPMVSDVTAVVDSFTFEHPIVAGSLIETVAVEGGKVILTVRPSNFEKVDAQGSVTPTSVAYAGSGTTQVVSKAQRSGGRPDLTQAKVIISGGRPLKDAATFESVIGGFADAVGGAAGATRAAVDSGIAANELQVGQTGKIVAPQLYIAAGISGSTQHMAGIKDSKVIVAINTDGDAPIFDSADLGLVGDLYTVLPELQQKLQK